MKGVNAWNLTAHAGEDAVTLEQWGKVLGWFGPLESPSVTDGFIDRVGARNILFSECGDCAVAVAVVRD